MASPKLRFKEFDEDWSDSKLGQLIGISSASRVFKEQWQTSGVPFFRTSDVVSISKNKENEKAYISLELFEELSKKSGKIQKGDLLVTGGGTIGIPYLVKNDEPLYFKDADLLWMKSSGIIDGSFLYNFFISPKFREYLKSISHTGTISHFTIEQAKVTPFQYPSKEEQTKIASFLSAVDEKISQLSQKLHLLSQYKQGMMKKLFSQQIRFKADDGSQFEEWVTKTIKELNLYISDGNYGELYPTSAQFVSHGVPFIRANNIKNLKVTNNDMRFIDENLHQILNSGHLKTNDIIVTTRGDIGMVALVDSSHEGSNINAQICLLRVVDQSQLSPQFLLYFLDSSFGQKQFKELQTGTALKQLPKKSLDKIITLVPSINEQTKIANFLSAIDQKIDVVSEQLKQAKLWKKGLLQQMFV